jgi:surface antigen
MQIDFPTTVPTQPVRNNKSFTAIVEKVKVAAFPTIRYSFPDADVKIIYDTNLGPVAVDVPKPPETVLKLEPTKYKPVALKSLKSLASKPVGIFGNGYSPGWCTWGVASWVNVPPGLGNANLWAYNAKQMGYVVSSVPKVGSVGQTSAGW